MRTHLFKNFTNLDVDKFQQHLATLYNLTEEEQDKLIEGLLQVVRKNTVGEVDEVIESTIQEIDKPKDELLKAFSILRYIYNEWSPISDFTDLLLKDLQELDLIPEKDGEEETNTYEFFLRLFSAIEEDNKHRMKKLYKASGVPNYIGLSAIVDFRPYFDAPYGTGNIKDVDEYNPVCLGWFPKTILNLTIDKGPVKTLNFQIDEVQIKNMIKILKSSLKDIEAAKRSVNLLEDDETTSSQK